MMALAVSAQSDFGSSVAWAFSSVRSKESTLAPEPSPRGFPPVMNTDAIRRSFPGQWAEYCKLTFKTAYGIQKAFPGIDSKTARAWIKGDHGPSGGFVAAVVKADPNAMEILGRTA